MGDLMWDVLLCAMNMIWSHWLINKVALTSNKAGQSQVGNSGRFRSLGNTIQPPQEPHASRLVSYSHLAILK